MYHYSLRHLDVDDKVCEQVDLTLIEEVYPKDVIIACIEQSAPWRQKKRRVRQTTVMSLVLFLLGMALWSRLNQALVWQKLVGKLSDLHPGAKPQGQLSDSGISRRRADVGSEGLQALMAKCCVPIATPASIPTAFFGRYRLTAIDGTIFTTAETQANEEAFGRSSNQYGKGAYPQVRAVLLVECGTHLILGAELSRYDVSEVHGAHRLLRLVGPQTLVTMDAGITSGGFLEAVRARKAHALGALEAGAWEKLPRQRRLRDGSVLAWVPKSAKGAACYPVKEGMWVRIISYRFTDERLGEPGKTYRLVTTLLNPVTAPADRLLELYHERWEVELVIDEIKTHERAGRKVLRSKTPEGVRQEIFATFLAHYLVRILMARAAVEQQQDPERLSFTESLFHVTEVVDLALLLEPEATAWLQRKLSERLRRTLLPPRQLRINRREVKQVYNKYKPKKRHLPPPKPFEPGERFLDFVALLDPLASTVAAAKGG